VSTSTRTRPSVCFELYAAGWPKDVRPYQARHSVASELGERDIDLGDVQGWLGHKHATTTRKHYAPVLVSRLKQASEAAGRTVRRMGGVAEPHGDRKISRPHCMRLAAGRPYMERSIRLLRIAVLCCGACAGCGTESRSLPLPTSASPTLQVIPPPGPQPTGPFIVSGIVSEVVDGQTVPLEGVHVEDSERHVSVKTGADGSYAIADVALTQFGGAHIYFAKNGYRSQVRIVPLTTNEIRVDMTLGRE
jgi:integrase-like protein